MSARDLVTVDPDKFEALLLANGLNLLQASKKWGIARTSLQKIRSKQPISLALAQEIMAEAGATTSILESSDILVEDILRLKMDPFSDRIVNPDTCRAPDQDYDEFVNWARRMEIASDCFPKGYPDWIPMDDDQKRSIHYLTDQTRLPKCDNILFARHVQDGHRIRPWHPDSQTGDHQFYVASEPIQPIWFCSKGTHLSPLALSQLKILRDGLRVQHSGEKVGTSLDDIISAASWQESVAHALEQLEKEGVAIFGQTVATLSPFETWMPALLACSRLKHGFMVIASADFDAVDLVYDRWVSGPIYGKRMAVDEIRGLNIDKN